MADRRKLLTQAFLAYALAANAVIGVWATVSPRGWYDDFPGFGQVWVAVDGPYNAHLVRDVAAWSLALAILCAAALWTLDRRLVTTAGAAVAVQSALHAQYHLTSDNPFDTSAELWQSAGGIVLLAALGALVAIVSWRGPAPSA